MQKKRFVRGSGSGSHKTTGIKKAILSSVSCQLSGNHHTLHLGCAFDNLQKLETSGTFSQGGMKLVNANDPSTFKVRRGKVGGYRDDFNEQQVAELEALVRDNILPELGYCQESTDA